jgi:tetratricopeptide (TPR) repeat protein
MRYQASMNRKQRRAALGLGKAESAAAGRIAGWFNAALGHQRADSTADAERVCRQILSVDPRHAQAIHLLGLIEHQRGRSDDAIKRLRRAIMLNDRDPVFHHNLGNILNTRGRPAEALICFERALALAPASVDTLYNLGNTCQELGQPEQAIVYFEKALRLRPDAVELHNNLGSALQDLGRLDEAIASYRAALQLRPDTVETLDNLAGALRVVGQLDAAQASFEQALALRPDRVESHMGLGVVLRVQGRLEDAVARYEQALALHPDHVETRNNLGVALVDLGRLGEAIREYEQALAQQPDRAELHNNLGIALQRQQRYADALACYRRALALKPDYAQAHFNHANVLLLTGEFEEGWPEYEWRFAVARYNRDFDRPQWSGEPFIGQSILIHAEQGFGDTLQFVRFVPAVARHGGKVILEVPEPLARIARTVSGVSEIITRGDPLPAFDYHCPLLSLPRVFRTNLASIPDAVPYLSVPTGLSAAWAEQIAAAPGLKVGVVWTGTTVGRIDLRLLQPLWDVPGVSWFSLQVGDASGDISLLGGVKIIDLSPWLLDFADTAAAVCQLDLVISVDTSGAHLAGALGRPTWIMLPTLPDWRWLLEREDSPWYPTARLFRQKEAGGWARVAGEMAEALAQMTR